MVTCLLQHFELCPVRQEMPTVLNLRPEICTGRGCGFQTVAGILPEVHSQQSGRGHRRAAEAQDPVAADIADQTHPCRLCCQDYNVHRNEYATNSLYHPRQLAPGAPNGRVLPAVGC